MAVASALAWPIPRARPGALGCSRPRHAVSRLVVWLQLIAARPLPQWTGSGLSMETGYPRKPNKDNSFRTLILHLRGKQGSGLVSSRVCHASQRPTQVFAVWGLRSRSFWILYPWNYSSSKIRSLAVLPLENLSGDASQDYFAEGMTDELITHLGQISALRVISRASVMTYKSLRKPLSVIARELNVEAVVEGSVLRSGDRVRITAQLIEVPADRHMWAQSYEGDLGYMLTLQYRVAGAIAEQIRATLNRQEKAALEKSKAVDPEAYEAYLKGRYFWNKRTADGLRKAIDYFSLAIEKDPNYAEAYSGLADSYALSGDWEYAILSPRDASPKAKAAATKALALDDSLGEAHTSLAFALDLYDWDWASADKEYQRAIALDPGYATAHHWYAWHLLVMGRNGEGFFELRKAESLDPLSLIISADLADALCIAHLYDESVQQSRKTLEMDPNFALAHYQLGQAFEQKHMHDEAIAERQTAIELSGSNAAFDSNLEIGRAH